MGKFGFLWMLVASMLLGCRGKSMRQPLEQPILQSEHAAAPSGVGVDLPVMSLPPPCQENEIVDDNRCVAPPSTCAETEVFLAHLNACVPATAENACFAKGQVFIEGACENNAYYAVCIRKTAVSEAMNTTLAKLKAVVSDETCEGSYAKLSAASKLDLSGTRKELDLRLIQDFRGLESLNAEKNALTTAAGLEKLTDLESLNLSNNAISDITALAGMSELEDLDLGDNKIKSIAPLSNMLRLRKLDLGENQITSLTPLTNMTRLRKLELHRNAALRDLRPLRNLQELENLDIARTDVIDLSPLKDLFLLELKIEKSTIAGFKSDKVSEKNCPVDAATSAVLFEACSALRGL